MKTKILIGVAVLLSLLAGVLLAAPIYGYEQWQLIGIQTETSTLLLRMWADYTTGMFKATGQFGRVVFDGAGVAVPKTANYTATKADVGQLLTFSNASTLTYTLYNVTSAPPFKSWWVQVQNRGAGNLNIDPNGLTIDGSGSALTLGANQGIVIYTDGFNYFTGRGIGSGVTFQTNTVNNSSQSLLNLTNGTGITVTNTSGGVVTIAASAGALSHGLGMSWGQGGGGTLVTGTSSYPSPFTCTIGSTWYAYSDQTVGFDVLVGGSSITGGGTPPSAAGSSNSGSTSGWSTSVTVGSLIGFRINSASGSPTVASVVLTCQ